MIALAVAAWLCSQRIPRRAGVSAGPAHRLEPGIDTWRLVAKSRGRPDVFWAILGISWFWFYGATFLTQFPNFAKNVLGGDEHVVTFLLASFSIGIGMGSLLCERLSGGRVELGLVPFGSIGLTVFAVGSRRFATHSMHATELAGVGAFLSQPAHWRVTADLVLIGLFGGFYIVPLYALIQERSESTHRSRIIAANNILNALFMVVSAGLAIGLLAAGISIPGLLLATGILNAFVALYIYRLVPEFLMRFPRPIHTVYRVQKEGLANVPEKGACILVCNHVSYVDAIVIAACVRRPVRFIMDYRIFRVPLLNWLFRTMNAIPVASGREDPVVKEAAFASAASALRDGEVIGLFPEGKLTDSGEMNPFRAGIERLVKDTPVPVIPMALRGLWGSFFSRSYEGKAMRRWRGMFPRIALVVAPAVLPEQVTPEALHARVLALRGDAR